MRNTLALIGAAVVTFGGLGWYLNWFKLETTPAPQGHRSLNIDIDTAKITEDLHRGSVTVQQALDKNKQDAVDKAKAAVDNKIDALKNKAFDAAKPLLDEGGEAEDYPFDFRKPR